MPCNEKFWIQFMKKYVVLAVAIVLIYFFQSFFLAAGGIGADSLSYFGIASDLPRPETNLFPLGFPVLVQLFHWIFQDYFWAAKLLNISMVIGILVFSWFKRFYFKETVLLFTGKTVFFVLNIVNSEGPFIFLLYFLLYFLHERFRGKMKAETFIMGSSLLMIAMFSVRYSAIYIYLGIGVFWMVKMMKGNHTPYKNDLFKFLMLSGAGIAGYLGFNYTTFGSFTGENLRGAPAQYQFIYLFRDFLGMTNVIDPFIGLKPASNSIGSMTFQVLVMVLDVGLLFYFIKLYKRKKASLARDFHHLLWIIGGVYTVTLFISGLFQQIEEMNVRMLAAANFCLFFSFLLIYFKDLNSDKMIFRVGCFLLIFLTAYSLKMPENYLENKREIARQMPKFKYKKFIFDDEKERKLVTTYEIPILKTTFQYSHTNAQQGTIKQSIAGTVNPQIKWLKYDTISDKSQVLYTSQLRLK